MKLTKRNHINPCFWTALWNKIYYDDFITGIKSPTGPRNQLLNYLEINTGQKLLEVADNIHFEKKLGLGDITPDQMAYFIEKYFPENYEAYKSKPHSKDETLLIDFENHFTGFERSPAYQVLLKFIKHPVLEIDDKIWLTIFMQLHTIRVDMLSDIQENLSEYPGGKFEYFWILKQNLQNPFYLFPHTLQIANSHWTLYKSKKGDFPLSDAPVIVKENSITATLSPYLLVVVNLNKRQVQQVIKVKNRVPYFLSLRLKGRIIENSSKGLIFLNEKTLERWLNSRIMKKKISSIKERIRPKCI